MFIVTNAFHSLLSLIYPDLCQICQKESKIKDHLFCVSCLSRIPFTDQQNQDINDFKDHFLNLSYPVYGIAIFQLNPGSGIAKIIHALKYHRNPTIGRKTGRLVGEILKNREELEIIDAIIPVPLHPEKKRKRGFNQCEEIAKGMSDNTGIPIDSNFLIRKKNTKTQTSLSRFQRLNNVRDAFELLNPDEFEYRHILLIDDVLTTGSTLQASADSILKVKKCKISMLTLAMGN